MDNNNAGCLRAAMMANAITVFPEPVGACRVPNVFCRTAINGNLLERLQSSGEGKVHFRERAAFIVKRNRFAVLTNDP